MLRVLITDDHAVIRFGLKQIISDSFDNALVGEAQDANDALRCIHKETWDLVIMDISLPGRSGLDALREINAAYPQLPVLVLSVYPEDQFALRVVKAGAAGFINKECAPEELVRAIRRVSSGRKYVSPALAEKIADHLSGDPNAPPHDSLSDREYEVFSKLASGRTVSQVADELCLSVKTVSTHRARILSKMRMQNNAQLTHYAMRNQLVDCPAW